MKKLVFFSLLLVAMFAFSSTEIFESPKAELLAEITTSSQRNLPICPKCSTIRVIETDNGSKIVEGRCRKNGKVFDCKKLRP